MTELLERAINLLKTLPAEEQDAIASRLLHELEEEKTWKAKFEATTDKQWDRMAEIVRQEIAAGDVIPSDEVLESIQAGLDAVKQGRTFPANQALIELKQKYEI